MNDTGSVQIHRIVEQRTVESLDRAAQGELRQPGELEADVGRGVGLVARQLPGHVIGGAEQSDRRGGLILAAELRLLRIGKAAALVLLDQALEVGRLGVELGKVCADLSSTAQYQEDVI